MANCSCHLRDWYEGNFYLQSVQPSRDFGAEAPVAVVFWKPGKAQVIMLEPVGKEGKKP